MESVFGAASSYERVPCYCEENILRLLSSPRLAGFPAWALMVSNEDRSVLMRGQWAGSGSEGVIIWDYHVLALATGADGIFALDLDTTLGFPLVAAEYLAASFPAGIGAPFAPRFRLMRSPEYVAGLSSNRAHMRGPDGTWLAPPPPWDPPGAGRPSNLFEWLDPWREGPGELFDLAGLLRFVAREGRA